MRQLDAKILYIWVVATSVHRPWRMMLVTAWTCDSFDVKGAATDASPSLICGGPSAPSSISAILAVISARLNCRYARQQIDHLRSDDVHTFSIGFVLRASLPLASAFSLIAASSG